jgi:hypothetical protein
VVTERNVHGAVWLSIGLLLAGLAVIGWLHVTSARHLAPAEA